MLQVNVEMLLWASIWSRISVGKPDLQIETSLEYDAPLSPDNTAPPSSPPTPRSNIAIVIAERLTRSQAARM